jgi:hypothetical protein
VVGGLGFEVVGGGFGAWFLVSVVRVSILEISVEVGGVGYGVGFGGFGLAVVCLQLGFG